jgi:hypothetical protein
MPRGEEALSVGELSALTLSGLCQHASDRKVAAAAVNGALDTDNPKAALVTLLTAAVCRVGCDHRKAAKAQARVVQAPVVAADSSDEEGAHRIPSRGVAARAGATTPAAADSSDDEA